MSANDARRVAVAGEDGGAVAEFVRVDQAERLVIAFGAQHGEHRAEDLLAVDRHVLADIVEQRAADEIAALIALQLEAAAVDDELGALGDALVDIAETLSRWTLLTSGPISASRSVAGPIFSARTRGASASISASAVFWPTGTATETAMQRSPAEP